ncbi:TRM5 tRNA methyltransferase 5, putative [Ichthyophthirius multifiliis]|uniref:tRNA (guanine(37)-N1)-methyltransferase n=1 Tax=Ichthyophthirius multifiliis TaxID=5932 RepID=G0R6L3_ICHMU|nr:TRM5 tRNA methyltransferase 5, putative [Ichthyophthirius multifiliis]EGR26893.1 TRM5 tRNA methyltransferase 5, putative [Ichthyophthirius multifiliis]|eukprot:XP_004023777.1 TRM5 tRNA methyltransferase 5, putative [Ichthyophthirius multifiliis]
MYTKDKFIKEDFSENIKVCCLKVKTKQIYEINQKLKSYLFQRQSFKRVLPLNNEHKLICLDQNLKLEKKEIDWPKNLLDFLSENSDIEILEKELTLKFDDFTINEILEKIIPLEFGIPSGFETIGHIAHFNLKPNQFPYKYLIGQVLIEKIKSIKTVVNKLEKLHNIYRTPELEILAGNPNLETKVNEGKCIFTLNFEKVYWCSRLITERDRVLQNFKPNQTILDLFCGVGPLAIRAAKIGCNVICNDLNPFCYDYLLINRKNNHVEDRTLCFNNDARKIVDLLLGKEKLKYPEQFWHFDHIYMNLPVLNIEFFDVFKGLLIKGDKNIWNENNLPFIHATGFVNETEGEDCLNLVEKRIQKKLRFFKKENIQHFNVIKNVTASKLMFCISFQLSIEDAKDQPDENYIYMQPEREDESLPLKVSNFGDIIKKKLNCKIELNNYKCIINIFFLNSFLIYQIVLLYVYFNTKILILYFSLLIVYNFFYYFQCN